MKNIWVMLATGFGLGLSPVASGTFGTLLGIPLAYALFTWQTEWMIQAVMALVLAVIAVPICDKAEKALGGKKDDGRIVADEYLTYPLTLIGLPINPVMALVLAVIAVPICDKAEKALGGKKDDGRIVADEYLTYPLTLIGLPINPVMLGVAFLTHRVLDIIKPWPARGLQRLSGGLGITIDDVFSSLYALAVNWAIYAYVLKGKTEWGF